MSLMQAEIKQNNESVIKYIRVRAHIAHMRKLFNEILPNGRYKSIALTKLEEACIFAGASIALDQEGEGWQSSTSGTGR
jgi:hypothetical protein